MSTTTDPETGPKRRPMSDELKAMSRIEAILEALPPATAQRVVAWAESLTNDRVEAEMDSLVVPDDMGW